MFKRGLTIVTTSAVGAIMRNISSIGLYACGDSSSVPEQTEVENMPFMDFSNMRSGTIPFGTAFTHADSDTVAHVERQAEAFPFSGCDCSFTQHGIFPAYGNVVVRSEDRLRAFCLAEFFQYCENTVTDDMMVVEGIRLRNDHIGEIAPHR